MDAIAAALAAALAVTPTASEAEAAPTAQTTAVEINGCDFFRPGETSFVACTITNAGQTPIAELRYSIKITEPGRAVPWMEMERGFLTSIRGGIEPGEAVQVNFLSERLPSRADPDEVEIHLTIQEAFDVNGDPIE